MKDSKVQELGINELALARELESLLQDLRQYNIVFTGAREAKPGKITIKLNAQRTRLCLLVPGTNEIEIDPENNVIIPPVNGEVNPIYNAVRTRLMNTRTELKREQYDESIGAAEQLILRHLLDTKQIEDRFPFLESFRQFINELPEINQDFIEASSRLRSINFEDWDIDEENSDDLRLKELEEIHRKLLSSFERYEDLGKKYIGSEDKKESESQGFMFSSVLSSVDGDTFNVIAIPGDGNCFYRAVADQLSRLNIRNDIGEYYNHEELRSLVIEYINANRNQGFGVDLAERLADHDPEGLHGDLPADIHNIEGYIAHHMNDGSWADSGTVGALAQRLGITLRVYRNDVPQTHNAGQGEDRRINLQYTGNHYNSLVPREEVELLPFEKLDPVKGYKIRRIFEILSTRKRGKELDRNLEIVGRALGLQERSIEKLKAYINVSNTSQPQATPATTENDRLGSDVLKNLPMSSTNPDVRHDPDIDSLEEIVKKLHLIANNITTGDGNRFNVIAIPGDGNCFYRAVADQLERLDIRNDSGQYYSHEELRSLVIEYINANREEDYGRILGERLANTDPEGLHGDLPADIHNIEGYIAHHRNNGAWADSGTVGALAQRLGITLRVYRNGAPETYNAGQDEDRTINLQYTGDHYNSLVRVVSNTVGCKPHTEEVKDNDNDNLPPPSTSSKIVSIASAVQTVESSSVDSDATENRKKEIANYVSKIEEYYIGKIGSYSKPICSWGVEEIQEWSRTNRGKLSKTFDGSEAATESICQAIAVMDRANQIATVSDENPYGNRLRDTQKTAIVIFMLTSDQGHVSQINTGEGKTTIVSIVQALKVLQGYRGHVITSNNVLASEGVKDKSLFYRLLDITVLDNNPDEKYSNGARECYGADIVYGSITSFQFDYLRDSFERQETLGTTDYNNTWVMLDEIDSLLIDQGGNIAKLSGPFPGMESLRYVYLNIWAELAKAEEEVIQEITAKLREKAEELSKKTSVVQASSSEGEYDDEQQMEYEEYEDSLRESFLDKVKAKLKDYDKLATLINRQIVASHLHQYAEDSLDRWIDNAFTAKYNYNENVEYKIIKKDGEDIIIPVDNQNTGVSMQNTILSNGLHQFLQIKHNLCLTYESLTSCYVSNLDYIKKYGSKLSGVTGTLGSDAERGLLGSVFNLGFSVVPPYKPKNFTGFQGRVSEDDNFINDVAVAALGELARTYTTLLRSSDGSIFDIIQIPGDGNCFYRGVTDQLERLNIRNDIGEYYSHEELRNLVIGYINANRDQEFGIDLARRLADTDTEGLHGDLPANIHNIGDYIAYHRNDGSWADSGTLGALAQHLGITIRVYRNGAPETYNAGQGEDRTINLQYTGDHYNSLVQVEGVELAKTFMPRAVLIVCASGLDADAIEKEIEEEAIAAGIKIRIRKYTDEAHAGVTEETLDVNDIVIATNLGGRGTDFKTTLQLEKNGGLHVIEAFLPCNKRVEDQGFGRTARQGNSGTGQIIARRSEVEALGIELTDVELEEIDFDIVLEARDKQEIDRVEDITQNKIYELAFKDKLFNKFSKKYGELKEQHKEGEDRLKWIYVLMDLKEKWSFWLEKQAYTADKIKGLVGIRLDDKVEIEYNKFLNEDHVKSIIRGNISCNPFYSICLAERYLESSTNKSDRDKARAELNNALRISDSKELLYSAYSKLFEIAIEDGGQVLERYKKAVAKIFFFPLDEQDPEYKIKAREYLEKARDALAIEYDYLDELMNGKKIDGNENKREKSILQLVLDSSGQSRQSSAASIITGDGNRFNVISIPGDGNCFYRAVADQLARLNITNRDGEHYTYEQLRQAALDYINVNREQGFGVDLAGRLANTDPEGLHGDLPGNIHSIGDYIAYHMNDGSWADSGTVGALAQHLGITIRVYRNGAPETYNAGQDEDRTINLQYTGNHYNSLVQVASHIVGDNPPNEEVKDNDDDDLPPPSTSSKIVSTASTVQTVESSTKDAGAISGSSGTGNGENKDDNISEELKGEDGSNILVKHLQSRLVCLGVYKGNIDSLIKQLEGDIEEFAQREDVINSRDGVIIDCRVPRYLSNLSSNDPNQKELKKLITTKSVDELEYVGMSPVYQVRKIHDVPDTVIEGAQWQIGGGLALLASAAVWPFLLPVNGPIAGAMISEGITDIIMALIDQGGSAFNSKDYTKGKIISYGISIATMGIGALMSSTRVLKKAIKACKSLADKLKAVKGPLSKVCGWLANKLEKLANYLKKIRRAIKYSRMSSIEQADKLAKLKDAKSLDKLKEFQKLQKSLKVSDVVASHGKQITQVVKTSVTGAIKGVAVSVAMEKIMTAGLNQMMSGLQPVIKEKVRAVVEEKINTQYSNGRFNTLSEDQINKAIAQLFITSFGEDAEHVSKEIALGVLRHSSNWKMQLATLAFETLLAGIDIAGCTDQMCNKLIDSLSREANGSSIRPSTEVINRIITELSEQISITIYGKVVAITGKVVVTLPKALYRGYKQHKEKQADKQAVQDIKKNLDIIDDADTKAKQAGTTCVHDAAAEMLGLDKESKSRKQLADAASLAASDNGASVDDVRNLLKNATGKDCTSHVLGEGAGDMKAHFDRQGSDRGIVCLSNSEGGMGHAVPVKFDGNQAWVTETMTLADYQRLNGYTRAEVVIPQGVNTSTLPGIQHQMNLNRITKATQSVGYVGQDGKMKFGGKHGNVSFKEKNGTTTFNKDLDCEVDEILNAIINNNYTEPNITLNLNKRYSETAILLAQRVFKKKSFHNQLQEKGFSRFTTRPPKVKDGNSACGNFEMYKGNSKINIHFNLDVTNKKYKDANQYRFDTHKGTNLNSLTTIQGVSTPFYEYTMEGIGNILRLRVRTEGSNTGLTDTIILPGTYIFSKKHSNIHVLLFYLNLYLINVMLHRNNQAMNRVIHPVILVPISLYGKHAVGVMFVAQEDGSGYKAFYLDPENTTIPEDLVAIFKDNGYQIEQLPTEGQKYTNCGPEVIENFMLYLTGERLSQEDAIVNNSRLIEQELLSSSHEAEEASFLTLKDSYSKQDRITVISNTAYNTQVSSDGYVIDNPTRYDIVTPQTIIDRVIVSADLGRESRDVLLELVHDYRINQDHDEVILGEVALD